MTGVHYRALPTLEIDGKQAPPNLMEDILQVTVEESLHLPGMFTLVIQNDYFPGRSQDERWRYHNLLQIGKPVKIGFTSSTTESKDYNQSKKNYVIEGEITGIETFFSEKSQAPVIVRGYDVGHRLHRGRYNRSFQNMTDSDIVKKIIQEVGIKAGTIDASGVAHDYAFQENQTNMEFLRQRADRIGFELFLQDGKVNFRKPKADSKKLTLTWLTDLHSFRVRVTSAEQVKEVEVRAWDYKEKRAIISTKKQEQVITKTQNGKGSETSNKFKGKPPKPKMILNWTCFNPKEADTKAQALCDELGGQFIYADAKAEGNTDIRPGRIVTLEDMGQHSGEYYVTETRHTYHERVYITEFSVRGLRGGNLLTALSPVNHLQPGQTFLVGIVTDNQDPKGWGRVKVKFPTLTEEHASNWARIVAIGAGNQRGFDCLPEINDEVLVAFEQGDIHRPYVIGGVWNGKDAPPNPVANDVANGKVRLRTFQTRVGHKIQFVEEDKGLSQKGAYIETAEGHKLRINDSQKFVEIETSGGHKIRLDDRSGSVSVSSRGRIENQAIASISSQAATIDTTASGMLSLKAGGAASINADGAVSVTAGAAISITAGGAITITASAITLSAGSVTIVTPTKVVPF